MFFLIFMGLHLSMYLLQLPTQNITAFMKIWQQGISDVKIIVLWTKSINFRHSARKMAQIYHYSFLIEPLGEERSESRITSKI